MIQIAIGMSLADWPDLDDMLPSSAGDGPSVAGQNGCYLH